jgi:endonuclease YncB( thermonuclease family)
MPSIGYSPEIDRFLSAVFRVALLLFLLALPCVPLVAAKQPAAVLPGTVTRVIDGDTIDVLLDSGRIRVRLHGVDAPEHDQQWGAEAAQWLRMRLMNYAITLDPVSQDQYERMVAVVHDGEVDINVELVRAGHAWAYRRYLRRADRELCAAEVTARRANSGLWALPPAARPAPWEYRHAQRHDPYTEYSQVTERSCMSQRGVKQQAVNQSR